MKSLITALRGFNRKERFLLLQWVLDRPGFPLGNGFRLKLEEACAVDLSGETFVAMDYHLDWLYAALRWAKDSLEPNQLIQRDSDDHPPLLMTGTQEDVDLLVASAGPKGTTSLILCEAKAYSPTSVDQINHKVERLRAIFGQNGDAFPGVAVRFVLLGPKAPPDSVSDGWPGWLTGPTGVARFIPLPPPEARYSIHRENSTSDWSWWKIAESPWGD